LFYSEQAFLARLLVMFPNLPGFTSRLPPKETRHFSRFSVNKGECIERDPFKVKERTTPDHRVIRFYGYTTENLDSNLENSRVRKITVLVYLKDKTVEMFEPTEPNSGLLQGAFLNRIQCDLPLTAFRIGHEIDIFGRKVHLVDADESTRKYYLDNFNITQASKMEISVDEFQELQEYKSKRNLKIQKSFESQYRESLLGRPFFNKDTVKYLENDKKVLRFYAVHDDLTTPHFERRPFVILFYLADDTLEIREQYPLNSGRDEFALFLKRTEIDGLKLSDLVIGEEITVFHVNFFIFDCDPFTRSFYTDKLCITLRDSINVSLPEPVIPRPQTPPYTGYGSWDDSMGSVYAITPKVPKKDMHKIFVNQGKILRFTAKFANPSVHDAGRLFIINYYLIDDQIMVHEPPARNTGILTGRYLEKNTYYNGNTRDIIKPEDLKPGNRISILTHEFLITGMDIYTEVHLKGEQRELKFDIPTVFQQLKTSLKQQFPVVRSIFRKFDSDKNSVLTLEEIKQCLHKFGFHLKEQENIEIMSLFDKYGNGQVTYATFCDAIFDESPHVILKPVDEKYTSEVLNAVDVRLETAKIRRAMKEIGGCVNAHYNLDKKLIMTLRNLCNGTRITSSKTIRAAFSEHGYEWDQTDIDRTCLFLIEHADLNAINYIDYIRNLVISFHDLVADK
jgi:EF-hand domain-containing protein 1